MQHTLDVNDAITCQCLAGTNLSAHCLWRVVRLAQTCCRRGQRASFSRKVFADMANSATLPTAKVAYRPALRSEAAYHLFCVEGLRFIPQTRWTSACRIVQDCLGCAASSENVEAVWLRLVTKEDDP